jgi:hypothetical protein
MHAYWVDHDHLEVPLPVMDEENGVIGDGIVVVEDGDPLFEQWRGHALNARPDPETADQPE